MLLKCILYILVHLNSVVFVKLLNWKNVTYTRNTHIFDNERCEDITIPMCQHFNYNKTMMPNLLHCQNQKEAAVKLHEIFHLVKMNCSSSLHFFLCITYIPVCSIYGKLIPPCHSLCIAAKFGCEKLLQHFNWPNDLSCENFPENNSELCISEKMNLNLVLTDSRFSDYEDKEIDVLRSVNVYYNNYHTSSNFSFKNEFRDFGFVCPKQFIVPHSENYILVIKDQTVHDCAVPCSELFFTEKERAYLRLWILCWSFICGLSCLCIVLTFLIDRQRFHYPERAIVFLSGLYLIIAIIYIFGFIMKDNLVCNFHNNTHKIPLMMQGTKNETCTILFMLLYFCTMASYLWWVILTFTWYLAAGLKWSHEAIGAYARYFHIIVWSIPALKTIAVLSLGRIEGDVLSGICYVGILNRIMLKGFVLIPIMIYLIVGLVFIITGFINLFRIQKIMKLDGKNTDKLEKLMMRIFLFSISYVVPIIIYIACLFYEERNLDVWLTNWQNDLCKNLKFSIPCPLRKNIYPEYFRKPNIFIFIIKYGMILATGIPLGFWILSKKTVNSWKIFYSKLFTNISKNKI